MAALALSIDKPRSRRASSSSAATDEIAWPRAVPARWTAAYTDIRSVDISRSREEDTVEVSYPTASERWSSNANQSARRFEIDGCVVARRRLVSVGQSDTVS
jgi:hypothetical protein